MTFERRFPTWIRVVAVVLALAGAIGTRAARRPLERLFGREVASKVTLFAIGNAFLAYKVTDLLVLLWASRRYGRCTILGEAAGSRALTFESPYSQAHARKAIVRFEDVTERTVTPHGVRILASRVTAASKHDAYDLGRLGRAIEALLIPCTPGQETDDVLALLDAPWGTESPPPSSGL